MMRSSLDNGDVGPCVGGQRKKGLSSRFSLRRLICSSPILGRRQRINSTSGSSKTHKGKDVPDSKSSGSKDYDRSNHLTNFLGNTAPHHAEIHQATSRTSVFTSSTKSGEVVQSLECPLCLAEYGPEDFCELQQCGHRACISCLQQYLRVEITESRVAINCPECPDAMHPNEIRDILDDPAMFEKYEDFMVRRVLAVDPDARWCPAPDCSFAVIASECASCPAIKCERPGCNSYFCYHCKAEWHPNQTCDAARAQRSPNIRSNSISYSQDSQHREDIKPCPRCQVLIVKMDDGSCNHMMCAVCGAEFCWLCMKEISDLHYLSPSGCTFWGKKPWSRKKKILWQLGTLVGAPVIIALVAGITVPAMVIGIPVWVGRKLYTRYKNGNKHKRNASIVGGVIGSIVISPILAGLAVGIGVPILLFYVYGVVPVSLCRSGGCGGSSGSEDNTDYGVTKNADNTSTDANSSRVANPSIGEVSLSLASGSQVLRDMDRESASTVALAGSVSGTVPPQKLEVQADLVSNQRLSLGSLSDKSVCASLVDDGASTRALAGSVLNYKGNGSDCCSCIATEDCASERVRFDDNVSFIAEKASISSGCSYKGKCNGNKTSFSRSDKVYDTLSNECIYMDSSNLSSTATTIIEEKPRKYISTSAALRKEFFLIKLNDETKPITKSFDDKMTINNDVIKVDNNRSLPAIIQEPLKSVTLTSVQSSPIVLESSKL